MSTDTIKDVKATEISIEIGDAGRITFHLYETNAPVEYDYACTKQLYDGGDRRYVLIRVPDIDLQVGRNGSGLYYTKPSDAMSQRDLTNRLMGAFNDGLRGAGEA